MNLIKRTSIRVYGRIYVGASRINLIKMEEEWEKNCSERNYIQILKIIQNILMKQRNLKIHLRLSLLI